MDKSEAALMIGILVLILGFFTLLFQQTHQENMAKIECEVTKAKGE